jgi:5-methylcytosine-specific restriction endonuclease McrA
MRRQTDARYRASPKGRATRRRSNTSAAKKERMEAYRATEAGRAATLRANKTPAGLARQARYFHRRRMAMAGPCSLTATEWKAIKAAQRELCGYCGRRKPLTMDHVMPLSLGGAHVKETS